MISLLDPITPRFINNVAEAIAIGKAAKEKMMTETPIGGGYSRQELCQHYRKKRNIRFAYAGKWYQRYLCQDCHKQIDVFVRDVDQNDDRDCEAADASQGIV